jgi:aryl-alcohol dehydrogenase-like predicted oxidoreductase
MQTLQAHDEKDLKERAMKQRILGKSGLAVSEIGLGCWQLGGDFGPVDDARARAVLEAADAAGINFWDTADVYGGGLSERRIGAYAGTDRPDIVVATKVGRDAELFPDGYTRDKVRANILGSAQRLGVETLDLVQLHCVPPEVLEDGEIFGWLEEFRTEGLLRHFGASVQTLEEADLALSHPGLTSLQIILNLFRQDALNELLPIAESQQVGIIVRLPLASGVLAGKMTRETRFAETDHRQYNRHGEAFSQGETFSGIPFETALELVEPLREQVPAGMSMAQMAMRWLLDQPAVSTVITGASRPEQVAENAAVSDLPPLSAELHEQLAAYYVDVVKPQIRVPI